MGLIEILINTIADMSGADDAASGLDNLEEQAGGAEEASEGLGDGLSSLNGILGALGIAISAGKILELAVQLDAAGAASNRAYDSFNTFTSGRADEYVTAIQDATNGLIDDEDALAAAQDLINQGMAQSSTEAAELIQNATILGAAFSQIGAKQAAEDFTRLLETLSPRQMREFGITIDEVTAKTQELMAANAGLTERQAEQQAIIALASQKADQFNGVLDDQQSHLDILATKWADFGESVGKALAELTDPAVQSAIQALEIATSDDLNANLEGMSVWERRVEVARRIEAATVAESGAYADSIEAIQRNRDATAENAAAKDEMSAATHRTAEEEAAFQVALEQQEAIQLRTLANINELTSSTGGLAGTFETANQLLSGYQLTQEQQLVMYEELGLATGQVTLKQIDEATQLRLLTNEYYNGQIGAEAYIAALNGIKAGGDAAFVALGTLEKAITDQGVAMGKSGDDLDKFVTSHLNEATKAASETEGEMKDIQAEAAKVGAIDVKPTVRTDDIVAATDRTKELFDALSGIPDTININVNYTTTGTPPPGVEASGPP